MPEYKATGIHQRSTALSPAQTLDLLIKKGEGRVLGTSKYRQMIMAIAGGFFLACVAHCCTILFGGMVNEGVSKMVATFAYGILFNGALLMITLTGVDLATSNMLYAFLLVTHCALHFRGQTKPGTMKVALWAAVTVTVSMIGNLFGAAGFGAAFSHWISNPNLEDGLCAMAHGKVAHAADYNFGTGILANTFVGFATWLSYCAMTVEGKLIATALPIISFVVGGGNHVVANMYTLYAAYYHNCEGVTLSNLSMNLVMAFLGNLTAGLIWGILLCLIHNPDPNYGELHETVYTRNWQDMSEGQDAEKRTVDLIRSVTINGFLDNTNQAERKEIIRKISMADWSGNPDFQKALGDCFESDSEKPMMPDIFTAEQEHNIINHPHVV